MTGYSSWGCKESDTTERLTVFSFRCVFNFIRKSFPKFLYHLYPHQWWWGILVTLHPITCYCESYSVCFKVIMFQFSSVAQSCLTVCNPIDCSTPGLPVHHQLLEFTQTHVLWVGDAIQPSHPVVPFSFLLQSFPPSGSFPMSQFFASSGQSIGVSASVSVLPMNTQGWSPLGWTGWISFQSKGLSRVFSTITVQKHQFFSTQISL